MRKYISFFTLLSLSQAFSVYNPSSLLKLCQNSLFHDPGISEESKPIFNEFIKNIQLTPKAFDYTGKKIKDSDKFAGLYLKNFNFTNAHLINVDLKKSILTETIFNKTTLENVDLRNTDLKGVQFINCKFINCDLRETDLTTTTLQGCKFKKIKLDDAILCDNFIFDANLSDYNLVKLYAEFIKKEEIGKAQALNKIFGVRKLKLKNTDLKNLDLTDINLQRADLNQAQMQGTRLSKTVIIPQYEDDVELIKLYDQYIRAGEKLNAQTLNQIFRGLHLNVCHTDLSNLQLIKINLRNTDLTGANLTNTNLTDATLKYAILWTSQLNGVKLSKDFTLDFKNINKLLYEWSEGGPNQVYCQNLINANVPVLQEVSSEDLQKINWKGRDLKNINGTNLILEDLDFTNTNFKKASLRSTHFRHTCLPGVNFKKISTNSPVFENSDFINFELNNIILLGTNFINCTFKEGIFNLCDFRFTLFSNCSFFNSVRFDNSRMYTGNFAPNTFQDCTFKDEFNSSILHTGSDVPEKFQKYIFEDESDKSFDEEIS